VNVSGSVFVSVSVSVSVSVRGFESKQESAKWQFLQIPSVVTTHVRTHCCMKKHTSYDEEMQSADILTTPRALLVVERVSPPKYDVLVRAAPVYDPMSMPTKLHAGGLHGIGPSIVGLQFCCQMM
jgi:hypothetical protein